MICARCGQPFADSALFQTCPGCRRPLRNQHRRKAAKFNKIYPRVARASVEAKKGRK